MGQQQLLLLIFGVVIVGLAIVAGVDSFTEGRIKTQREAAMSEALRITSHIQDWKTRPLAFGGGGSGTGEQNFEGLTLQAIGLSTLGADGPHVTTHGCFVLDGTTTGATISVYRDTTSSVCDTDTGIATVTITGISPQDIAWSYY